MELSTLHIVHELALSLLVCGLLALVFAFLIDKYKKARILFRLSLLLSVFSHVGLVAIYLNSLMRLGGGVTLLATPSLIVLVSSLSLLGVVIVFSQMPLQIIRGLLLLSMILSCFAVYGAHGVQLSEMVSLDKMLAFHIVMGLLFELLSVFAMVFSISFVMLSSKLSQGRVIGLRDQYPSLESAETSILMCLSGILVSSVLVFLSGYWRESEQNLSPKFLYLLFNCGISVISIWLYYRTGVAFRRIAKWIASLLFLSLLMQLWTRLGFS